MKPTLLVLAAGMGSRYGGLKQMDGLGPSGETIIDYSIYDAVRAGFGKVVYIVREYFLEQFRDTVKQKYGNVRCPDGEPLQFDFVTQELSKIPAGHKVNPEREKPWGTAHAVLMARDIIHEPFVVIKLITKPWLIGRNLQFLGSSIYSKRDGRGTDANGRILTIALRDRDSCSSRQCLGFVFQRHLNGSLSYESPVVL